MTLKGAAQSLFAIAFVPPLFSILWKRVWPGPSLPFMPNQQALNGLIATGTDCSTEVVSDWPKLA